MHKKITDFTKGSIPRHLIAFAIPMFLGNLLQALYNIVNSIWVGRFLGPQALAAVSVGFPIIFTLVALIMGLAMAMTTLVAQYYGAKRQDLMMKTIGNSMVLLSIFGVITTLIGVFYNRQALILINTFGSTVVAGFGAASRIDQFAFMPAMSVGMAVSALVAQNLGARQDQRVQEAVYWSSLLGAGITLPVSLLAILVPNLILLPFTTDAEVIKAGSLYLRYLGFAYIPLALMFTLGGVLRGAGDTFLAMLFTLISLWLVRVPLAAYLSHLASLGVQGILVALTISPYTGVLLNYLYYRSGKWRKSLVEEAAIALPPQDFPDN